MDWAMLFTMQKKLDSYIEENHQLQSEDLFNDKFLALLVEIGELANETRCFKFWSTKTDVNEKEILEEYVDGIHFILSLGLEKNFTIESLSEIEQSQSMTDQFNAIYRSAIFFMEETTIENYIDLFTLYLQLGKMLGFSPNDIKKAYFEKNEVNYLRQNQGY